jgi:ABC-2 type transport system permease protein
MTTLTSQAAEEAVSGHPGQPGATARRELNAVFAIAWREILRAVKSPLSIAFTIIFPILFIGILGGSISQNLAGALPFAYLPYMLIGMVANTMYQGTITGVTNLVEERENDITAELFVAPISRYAVLVGKLIGSGIAACVALVGIIGMIVVMQIPMDPGDLLRVIALTRSWRSRVARWASSSASPRTPRPSRSRPAADLPADLPVRGAHPGSGLVRRARFLANVIPMTYSIDLARNIF